MVPKLPKTDDCISKKKKKLNKWKEAILFVI